MTGEIKILTFSTLFPNRAQPHHGVFVENRLRHLMENNEVSARVIAPVPWFPSTSALFGDYATFAKVPKTDVRAGLEVTYPRYPLIPKVGMNLTPSLMYRAVKPLVTRLLRDGFDFDLIDAHYFYPDGVAAAYLARAVNKPFTVTARGTDLNLIPNYPTPRRLITEAATQADGLITVCQALKDELVKLGIAEQRVEVLRNGVDLELFQPKDREAAKAKFGVSGPILLSVGHLIERKGHDLIIKGLPRIPDATLLIAGTGRRTPRYVLWPTRSDWATGCASWALFHTRRCPTSTAPLTFWCWHPAAKAGPTFFWKRWLAEPRRRRPMSGARRK